MAQHLSRLAEQIDPAVARSPDAIRVAKLLADVYDILESKAFQSRLKENGLASDAGDELRQVCAKAHRALREARQPSREVLDLLRSAPGFLSGARDWRTHFSVGTGFEYLQKAIQEATRDSGALGIMTASFEYWLAVKAADSTITTLRKELEHYQGQLSKDRPEGQVTADVADVRATAEARSNGIQNLLDKWEGFVAHLPVSTHTRDTDGSTKIPDWP
jgi:hypothetical protein